MKKSDPQGIASPRTPSAGGASLGYQTPDCPTDNIENATGSAALSEHRTDVTRKYIQSSIERLRVLESSCPATIDRMSSETARCFLAGGKVLICGNGGSASDALHIAAEFVGRFKLERSPLPCIALNTNVSAMTAIGNDYGFDEIFSRQLRAFGNPGDVFIAISTSGNSPNVIRALAEARAAGILTIGMTGEKGGRMKSDGLCDILLSVPSDDTPKIQEMHIVCAHVYCQLVEEFMAESEKKNEDRQ